MRLLRPALRWINLVWAKSKGAQVSPSAFISFQGKLDIARTARVHFADSVSIFKNYRIEAGEGAVISLGHDVHFREGARLYAAKGAKIDIKAGCYFNHDVSIVAVEAITIGENSIFGPLCYLSDNDHGMVKGVLIKEQPQQTKPVDIGADVWLGVGATLLKGSSVGNGAVIAARAVVTKLVPPQEIWGGVPAKRIGVRRDFQQNA